jgi:hypothetical protein
MVHSGVQSEQMAIQHMGQPGQGVPVRSMDGANCPSQRFPREPLRNVIILRDIDGIVIIDELEFMDLPKDKARRKEDQKTHQKRFISYGMILLFKSMRTDHLALGHPVVINQP